MTARKKKNYKSARNRKVSYKRKKEKDKVSLGLLLFLAVLIVTGLIYQWKLDETNSFFTELENQIVGSELCEEMNVKESFSRITEQVQGSLKEFTDSEFTFLENVNTLLASGDGLEETEDSLQYQVTEVGELEVHFLDVGQGDATLLLCDGEAMLIDAGDNSQGTGVQNYLEKQGVERLTYVIGTHPHADHIGGLDVILYKFDCETVIMPDMEYDSNTYDDVIQTMLQKNYKLENPIVGNTYEFGTAIITILGPVSYDYNDNINDYSVSVSVTHGENTFIFTGDAEMDAEEDMIETNLSLDADVYQVGHHGSSSSSSQAFIDALSPTWAVISCGEGNSYGHPHAETLNRLRSEGILVFRTDEQGTIVATSDGENITWNMSPSETWQVGESG